MTAMPKVLIVEDDEVIAQGMARHLGAAGFDAVWVGNGDQGLARLRYEQPDVCVLDLMLPGLDGWKLIETIRAEGIGTPIVVVSARGTEHDRVHALEIGADDYLVKPFSLAELLARLRALVRRTAAERPTVLTVDDLRLDPATRAVWRADVELQLSTKEFALLELFMRRPDEVISRIELLEHGWDMAYENRSNVITVYMRTLREKIDRPFGRASLETVRGAGYRLRASSEA
jgi:two-component system OmpR family response regulator